MTDATTHKVPMMNNYLAWYHLKKWSLYNQLVDDFSFTAVFHYLKQIWTHAVSKCSDWLRYCSHGLFQSWDATRACYIPWKSWEVFFLSYQEHEQSFCWPGHASWETRAQNSWGVLIRPFHCRICLTPASSFFYLNMFDFCKFVVFFNL